MMRLFACLALLCPRPCVVAAGGTDAREEVSLSTLKRQAAHDDVHAIRELAFRGDASVIPLLRQIVAKGDWREVYAGASAGAHKLDPQTRKKRVRVQHRGEAVLAAKFALARLGDKAALDEFIVGLSTSVAAWRYRCIITLGEIGSRAAVPALAESLDSKDECRAPAADVGGVSCSEAARWALTQILPDVASRLEAGDPIIRPVPASVWKQWWDENRERWRWKP